MTLNRPDAFNALSEALMSALQLGLDKLAQDDSVRVVVIAAAGKALCAGHDLREMRASPSHDYYQALFKQCAKLMMSIQKLPVPVIARVHGIATAAGCQLVAMCDLAVAASSARFAVSGVNPVFYTHLDVYKRQVLCVQKPYGLARERLRQAS